MRSGDPSRMDYNKSFSQLECDELYVKEFRQIVFHPLPALVHKNKGGFRAYTGGEYDEEEYDVIDGMWDHEHCDICNFSIEEDYTYWVNSDNNILCDECYDHLVQYSKDKQATR